MSIYTNLIKNAIKYTEQGSIEFGNTIKGNFIEFYVKDTGIGVEPERMEAIFDRFVQADIEDIMARQGAGLGLSISEAYVKMLGGKIWVTSEKRKGSTFYFTIPYIKTSAAVPDTIAETPNTQTEKETRKLKILIVEDEETSILLIEAMLAKINCEILLARNGVEAIGQCKENPDLDIIFMDIRMPVMNGYEAVRQIRQLNKTVIIVAQTANALTQDIEKSIEAGCNEHLSKPIIKNELFSIMQHYFNYRHQAPTIDKNPREFENN